MPKFSGELPTRFDKATVGDPVFTYVQDVMCTFITAELRVAPGKPPVNMECELLL